MINFVYFNKDNIKNKKTEYVLSNNSNMCYMNNLSRVNIFIGKNNSGKSRLMRNLFNNKYEQKNFENKGQVRGNIKSFIFHLRNCDLNNLEEYKKLINYTNLNDNEIVDLIFKIYFYVEKNKPELNNLTFKGYIEKIIESYGNVNLVRNNLIYIPILRGIEKFSMSSNRFKAQNDEFRLSEGERKELDEYIKQVDEVYYNKINKNYFGDKALPYSIHTGETMYEEIQKKLLGKESERMQIKEYEEFLSNNFFENKSISLIPNISMGYLYINIDGEEHELHNFGDGMKQLIIITYKMFIHKDEEMIYFIEEPELNLHPGLQRKLIDIMLSNDFSKHQYFITTHSNHMVDLLLDYSKISVYKFEKLKNKKIRIMHCERGDNEILQLIGAKPSSIFNSNCSIWVEGITDRLYIRKYLELYQEYLKKRGDKDSNKLLREDIDFSFIEYGGGNITHLNFLDYIVNPENINTKFISQNALVIADNDFPPEGHEKYIRLQKLEKNLNKHFYKLPVREIENLLSRDILLKIVRKRENDENAFFKPDINTKNKSFIEGRIGVLLEKSVKVSNGKNKHAYKLTNSTSLYNKLDFCNLAIECLEKYDDLSDDAKALTEIVYDFIMNNKK